MKLSCVFVLLCSPPFKHKHFYQNREIQDGPSPLANGVTPAKVQLQDKRWDPAGQVGHPLILFLKKTVFPKKPLYPKNRQETLRKLLYLPQKISRTLNLEPASTPGGGTTSPGEEEGEPDPTSEAIAVGTLAFFGYLAVFGLKALGTDVAFQLFAERLEDFPDCGTRPAGISEPELCFQNCNWVDSELEIKDTRTISFSTYIQNVDTYIRPYRIPTDTSCLDGCPVLERGSSFDALYNICLNCGKSFYECYILSRGNTNESPSTGAYTNVGVYFTPTSPLDEIFSYCVAEQVKKGVSICTLTGLKILTAATSTLVTNSISCLKLLGVPTSNGITWSQSLYVRRKKRDASRDEDYENYKRKNTTAAETRTSITDFKVAYTNSKTPWLCSLKTFGFRGRHRCGVTLLSGPPKETILVSAAHCNLLCKSTEAGSPLEMCCCRASTDDASCVKTSSYCGSNPMLYLAQPSDLQIVCGAFSLEEIPEKQSPSPEFTLNVNKITIHPKFQNGNPLGGYDVAVYHVSNPQGLAEFFSTREIYPACLPRNPSEYSTKVGRVTGWIDPEPTFRSSAESLNQYVYVNMIRKQYLFTAKDTCSDPAYMKSNTFYPRGTQCYQDASYTSCITFGNSGSPLVREFTDSGTKRFAFAGPISISKGCDITRKQTIFQNRYGAYVPIFYLRSENSAVITDVRCYLDWIGAQYNLKPPAGWVEPSTCSQTTGDINDQNKDSCLTNLGTQCDFSKSGWEQCKLQTFEGFAYNIYQCYDTTGVLANCANNCKGVNPNSIVVGGVAVGIAGAAAGASILGPILTGTGAVGLAGAGSFVANRNCPPGQCRPRGSATCCMLRLQEGRLRCPRSC